MAQNRVYHRTPMGSPLMKLKGEPWKEGDWSNRPTMQLDLVDNAPNWTCWPRNPDEQNTPAPKEGKTMYQWPIAGGTTPQETVRILNAIIRIAESDEVGHYEANMMSKPLDEDGNPTKGPLVPRTKLRVGRDLDGYMFISAMAKGRPIPTIRFAGNLWVNFMTDKGDVEKVADSKEEAITWAQMQLMQLGPCMARYYDANNNWQPDDKDGEKSGNKSSAPAKSTPTEW